MYQLDNLRIRIAEHLVLTDKQNYIINMFSARFPVSENKGLCTICVNVHTHGDFDKVNLIIFKLSKIFHMVIEAALPLGIMFMNI